MFLFEHCAFWGQWLVAFDAFGSHSAASLGPHATWHDEWSCGVCDTQQTCALGQSDALAHASDVALFGHVVAHW
jgi:hypothetical protein